MSFAILIPGTTEDRSVFRGRTRPDTRDRRPVVLGVQGLSIPPAPPPPNRPAARAFASPSPCRALKGASSSSPRPFQTHGGIFPFLLRHLAREGDLQTHFSTSSDTIASLHAVKTHGCRHRQAGGPLRSTKSSSVLPWFSSATARNSVRPPPGRFQAHDHALASRSLALPDAAKRKWMTGGPSGCPEPCRHIWRCLPTTADGSTEGCCTDFHPAPPPSCVSVHPKRRR